MRASRSHRRARRSLAELGGEARGRLRQMVSGARLAVLPTTDIVTKVEERLAPGMVGLVVAARRGVTVDHVIAVAELLAARGYSVTPEIDSSGLRSQRHIEEIIGRLARRSINRVVMAEHDSPSPVDTEDLLAYLAGHPAAPAEIGIVAFPHGRPGVAPDQEAARLLDRGRYASFLSAATSVEPARLVAWIAEMRVRGIEQPIEVGVPGVVPIAVLRRESPAVAASLGVRDRAPFDPTPLLGALADDHALDRLGLAGVRLETCNEVGPTEDWRQRLYDQTVTARSG